METVFESRTDAGRQLGHALQRLRPQHPVVVALPRGGVPVAAEVARVLDAPLDLLLVRKIGAPSQPELAVAAVAEGNEPALEIDAGTLAQSGASMEYVRRELPHQWQEIKRRRRLYLKERASMDLHGRTAVLVDDGVATGTTVRAAIQALRRRGPARLVLAVPVAPQSQVIALAARVDEVVCLSAPVWFGSVGEHYRDFSQTTDDEVVQLMDTSRLESGRGADERIDHAGRGQS